MPRPFDPQRALSLAAQTFEIEAAALRGLTARQGQGFIRAVQIPQRLAGMLTIGHLLRAKVV